MKTFIPHLRAQGLSPQQWRVLRALYEYGSMEITVLADKCFLLMPSLSRIIQNLDEKGIISRKTSEQDHRRSVIRLTDKGAELVDMIAPESEVLYERITNAFGYGKLELLYELLDELVVKLDDLDNDAE